MFCFYFRRSIYTVDLSLLCPDLPRIYCVLRGTSVVLPDETLLGDLGLGVVWWTGGVRSQRERLDPTTVPEVVTDRVWSLSGSGPR